MEGMNHQSMQYPRECYPQYSSSDSVSTYHTSGYLSPPYSISRRSTTETAYASSTCGLGITRCQSFTPQAEHSLYTTGAKSSNFPASTQDQTSSAQSMPSPRYRDTPPVYISNNGTLPSRMTPGNHHQSIHHSPATLIPLTEENYYQQSTYDENTNPRGLESYSETSHFGYQPDPMQEGKWVATSHEVLAVPEASTQDVTWQSGSSQPYHYHIHYPTFGSYASQHHGPTVRHPYGRQDSQITAISTPPASQEGSPVHETDGCLRAVQYCSPEAYNTKEESPCDASSPTAALGVIANDSNIRAAIRTHDKNGKRLLGRLNKSAVPRPTLQCKHCFKTFSKHSKLRDHEKSHEKSTAICPEPHCRKVYGRQADLARHQRSHHRGHLFPCKYCSKTFNRSDITRRHEEHSCRQRRAERATLGLTRNDIRSR